MIDQESVRVNGSECGGRSHPRAARPTCLCKRRGGNVCMSDATPPPRFPCKYVDIVLGDICLLASSLAPFAGISLGHRLYVRMDVYMDLAHDTTAVTSLAHNWL